MHQETKIQLDYSCHQPFWNFKKQDGDKYCKTCKHKTYDFSESTPEEILLILEQNNGKACGTFYKDQVEINEHTKHSPAAYKIAMASVFSFFVATELDAQSTANDTVKTEQHASTSQGKAVVYERDEKGNEITACPINAAPEPVATKPYKRKKRIRIGDYYLNWKFPFVHRMSSGFYRAAPRSFFPHKDKVRAQF